jgi:hypothetical protein
MTMGSNLFRVRAQKSTVKESPALAPTPIIISLSALTLSNSPLSPELKISGVSISFLFDRTNYLEPEYLSKMHDIPGPGHYKAIGIDAEGCYSVSTMP